MVFTVENQASQSPLIEAVWRGESRQAGLFTSLAVSQSELVITRQRGTITLVMRGPETVASTAICPEGAEFFGITFKLGAFMPQLPPAQLVDRHATLRPATQDSFWLGDQTWQIPDLEDAEDFVERLVRQHQLRFEPVVDALLRDELTTQNETTVRTLQRRFQGATGLSHRAVRQIDRARRAVALLENGVAIPDVIHNLGYSDQPHLTKVLKQLVGNTPARIALVPSPHSSLTGWELLQRPLNLE